MTCHILNTTKISKKLKLKLLKHDFVAKVARGCYSYDVIAP